MTWPKEDAVHLAWNAVQKKILKTVIRGEIYGGGVWRSKHSITSLASMGHTITELSGIQANV